MEGFWKVFLRDSMTKREEKKNKKKKVYTHRRPPEHESEGNNERRYGGHTLIFPRVSSQIFYIYINK